MCNIFKKIKDNSIWELDGEQIVVWKTGWIFNYDIYPTVYYYFIKDKKNLHYITRAEFLMKANKLN